MADVVMPRLSDSMEEGTILQWLKKVGDEVAVGDELVEIETDKANMAYESDVAGTLTEILAEEGETLPIGTPIARIGDSAEGSERSTAGPDAADGGACGRGSVLDPPTSAPPAEEASETAAEAPTARSSAPAEQPLRRQAADGGQGFAAGQAHGEGERSRPEQAQRLGAWRADRQGGRGEGGFFRGWRGAEGPRTEARPRPQAPPAAAPGPAVETAKGEVTYRRALQAPGDGRPADGRVEGDRAALLPGGRGRHERRRGGAGEDQGDGGEGDVVPSFNDMVVKACALALREHPRANGAYRDGRFELYSRVNVGIAVAAPDALVVPTVFDADRKGLRQIASESRALAQRVRDGQITPPELSGATFTVSNLGMYGIDSFSAVINPPQAAILAVGAINERAGRFATASCPRPPDAGQPSPATTASSTAPRAPSSWPASARCSRSHSPWPSERTRGAGSSAAQQVFFAPVTAFQARPREKSAATSEDAGVGGAGSGPVAAAQEAAAAAGDRPVGGEVDADEEVARAGDVEAEALPPDPEGAARAARPSGSTSGSGSRTA